MVSNKCWNTVDQFFFQTISYVQNWLSLRMTTKTSCTILHATVHYWTCIQQEVVQNYWWILYLHSHEISSQFSFLPPIVTKTNLAVHEDKNKATFVKVCEWLCPASVADTQYNIVLLPNCTHHQLYKIGIPTSPPHSSPCQSSQQGTYFPGEMGEGGKHGWQACEWSLTITHMGGNADCPCKHGENPTYSTVGDRRLAGLQVNFA